MLWLTDLNSWCNILIKMWSSWHLIKRSMYAIHKSNTQCWNLSVRSHVSSPKQANVFRLNLVLWSIPKVGELNFGFYLSRTAWVLHEPEIELNTSCKKLLVVQNIFFSWRYIKFCLEISSIWCIMKVQSKVKVKLSLSF